MYNNEIYNFSKNRQSVKQKAIYIKAATEVRKLSSWFFKVQVIKPSWCRKLDLKQN